MKTVEQLSDVDTRMTTTAECALVVTVTYPSAAAMRLHYRVRNLSLLPMYLCNQLYKEVQRHPATGEAVFMVQPSLANVQLEGQRVTVGKTVVDVPDWMFVEALQMPCLSRLLPGEELEEVVDLPSPLVPYTVYDYSAPQGLLVQCQLQFQLGYFLASPYTESLITTASTPTGYAYRIGPFPASEQSLITSGLFAESVPVVSPE